MNNGVGDNVFDEEDSIDVVDSKFAIGKRDSAVVDEGLDVAGARVKALGFVHDAREKRGVVLPLPPLGLRYTRCFLRYFDVVLHSDSTASDYFPCTFSRGGLPAFNATFSLAPDKPVCL